MSTCDACGENRAETLHRIRNLINVIGALSQQTIREVSSLDDFDQRFGDRLAILARAQSLLSRSDGQAGLAFDVIVRAALESTPGHLVSLDGPLNVLVARSGLQTLTLALHELAAEARRSSTGSTIHVAWAVDGARLRVDWRERSPASSARGTYGRELIERALPFKLDATTRYEPTADGIHVTIDLPVAPPR